MQNGLHPHNLTLLLFENLARYHAPLSQIDQLLLLRQDL